MYDISIENKYNAGTIFRKAFHHAHAIHTDGGTCLEFGVYTGGTYTYQADYIKSHYTNDILIGFDSWEGLPEEESGVWYPGRHNAGEYKSTKSKVMHKLFNLGITSLNDQFRLIDGFYSESLQESLRETIKDVIFINIDVDLYISTVELLQFVRPLIKKDLIIYWDDWNNPADGREEGSYGESLAWKEFVEETGIEYIEVDRNQYNQCYMRIKG